MENILPFLHLQQLCRRWFGFAVTIVAGTLLLVLCSNFIAATLLVVPKMKLLQAGCGSHSATACSKAAKTNCCNYDIFIRVRFLSSMRLEVSRSLEIETGFYVLLQYRTIGETEFSACCYTYKSNISCCHRCFLWFKFSGEKLWYFFMHPALLFQRRCCWLGASTDKTETTCPFKITWSTGESYLADVWGKWLKIT